ncbi:glutamate synthase-related protein [Deinococcus maricopensis]|uniref:Glutamate synthase (Ferredoxin) n=1 Tax=Deinococcus maricopensis (strain DSM 21211 / LMG 22137 / NRRL B-23946 / LB-34) TaxID=709986 RepID=E8U965_DEIML|nr:glutamate synthase-related protein [Deinococcus maricopensis]ADV67604.1 Glutamate synthase (ferredoxin) [Deinococcus maricopensis DSM 21211]
MTRAAHTPDHPDQQPTRAPESLYRQAERARLEPRFPGNFDEIGHDACGIIAKIRKTGEATHGNVTRALEELAHMAHRSGEVRGEGDGAGIQTDIPRLIWKRYLDEAGLDASVVDTADFWVGHFFVPQGHNPRELLDALRVHAGRYGLQVLLEKQGNVYSRALGPVARLTEPQFVQVAGLVTGDSNHERNGKLFTLGLDLEAKLPVHVVSLSTASVVYKVRGSAELLPRYYPELSLPDFMSVCTIGHNRYSTNTLSTFEQVQPFTLLAHNGEINTIDRLRKEGTQLGLPLTGGSDSQDLNRVLSGYIFDRGMSLLEAIESVFPPVISELRHFSSSLQNAYIGLRVGGGPLAQGPAAIISRQGNECVFSVDAMGLRPLWFGETEKEYFWSSERGVIPLGTMVRDPQPFAPGEKMVACLSGGTVKLHYNQNVQNLILERVHGKGYNFDDAHVRIEGPHYAAPTNDAAPAFTKAARAAFGWDRWDEDYVKALADKGAEPIASLGFDGPMAALRPEKPNLAEFFKETVAVVTNPAIDRERETEHFSTRVLLGRRPLPGSSDGHSVDLLTPVLATTEAVAGKYGTLTVQGLQAAFHVATLTPNLRADEPLSVALTRLKRAAADAVRAGAEVLLLDDTALYANGEAALDILLAVGALDRYLTAERDEDGVSLRRLTSVAVRSAQIRNLHDVMVLIGLGADAAEPSAMYALYSGESAEANLVGGLTKGIEKVMSTMGIHELRGYGQNFSALGLASDLLTELGVRGFWGGEAGYTLTGLEGTLKKRLEKYGANSEVMDRDQRFNPRVFKAAFSLANGEISAEDYQQRIRALELEMPLSARQLLEFKTPDGAEHVDPDGVDLAIGGHSLPFVISAMSFGSQGETAFRSYVEAAKRLNIVAMNGEGGEIPSMIGQYNHWRGQQVASGRFGVSSVMLNSAHVIEIKVGQGAKPGEGGHLPGKKVSVKVAAARHAVQGTDLISPSNNHDVYSIEDLAQLIEELKTVAPQAKISVKVPVVPGIGTIALGVAKAGAHIITLSGFEGGTGAARSHALKYAGMPVEFGVKRAHKALVSAGIRDKIELWADGGLKTALDVARVVALGANRVGFGTLSMVAIGCTICRGCQLDTCHVGITTQVETEEEAKAHGFKRFVPRVLPTEVDRLAAFYGGLAEELRRIVARLGLHSLQDLTGRSDLLVAQGAALDFTELLTPAEDVPAWSSLGRRVIHKPLNYMTRMVSEWVNDAIEDEGEDEIVYRDGPVASAERALGTHLVGTLTRRKPNASRVKLHFEAGSIPGNGLGAFNNAPVEIQVDGGAQDGVGKSSLGGRIVILKGRNHQGERVDGSVGKSFAYGAIGGRFLIQGNADSRFCVRLSGADVVLGGELRTPVDDTLGGLATRANAKGYAFEYMTAGRAVVVGDPGPWICSGMSGGVVYLRHEPEHGLDDAALNRRLARGSNVVILPLNATGVADLRELLGDYHQTLVKSEQHGAARRIAELLVDPAAHFRMVLPAAQSVDQSVATE